VRAWRSPRARADRAAAPYLTDRGWALHGISIRDLLAANDLPPLEDDDLRMGDLIYVSGALDKTTKVPASA
jgi:hypothetical protein